MNKVSKPLTAAKAIRYYKLEYAEAGNSQYKQAEMLGRWHGKFAEELGLTGAVTEEQFARMAHGQDPA
ncbi:MAG TPA: relaxase domain-containing protein, partial [Bryobacteraceae bacterium]|nr:relaxase domain-containing protein [Bryobacteraceae bacterium]